MVTKAFFSTPEGIIVLSVLVLLVLAIGGVVWYFIKKNQQQKEAIAALQNSLDDICTFNKSVLHARYFRFMGNVQADASALKMDMESAKIAGILTDTDTICMSTYLDSFCASAEQAKSIFEVNKMNV